MKILVSREPKSCKSCPFCLNGNSPECRLIGLLSTVDEKDERCLLVEFNKHFIGDGFFCG